MGKPDPEPAEVVEEGAPLWVVTFGDLMSLLLCFFVLLLSFSEMDRQKYKELSGSMQNAFGVQRKKQVFDIPKGQKIIAKNFDQEAITLSKETDILEQVRQAIQDSFGGLGNSIEYDADEYKVRIRLMGESTFHSGRADIRETMMPLLATIAEVFRKNKENIIIAGHTDNVPLKEGGQFKTNLQLSMARAASVADFFLSEGSIEPHRISTMGFGEHRPLDTNDNPQGRQKNRRVEIILGAMPNLNQI
ncbi:MAG: type VI secretion system protein TssL [Deltaproteobacteria bacterium]|nr:MAG: type VI secretion system protein TssL [Deltaproteobacteria bacterium]RLC16919.1 MAG: type VI secretion system protein TssL [Deltaproteobacteria bacterium]